MWKRFKTNLNKGFISRYLLACLALLPSSARPANWVTDLPSAQAAAKAENKIVLIDFTGSDWCGWCIRLRNEVFSTPEFDAFANDHLVLVEADFPRRKPQDAALKQANAALARQFHVEGYPTLIVLNGDGKQIGHLGYMPGGPQPFLSELSKISGAAPPAPPPAAKQTKSADSPPAPLFNGAPTFPPPKFNEVMLKGILGPRNKRLAMINNKTLGVGESALVRVGEGQVNVKCLEIRENSVLVTMDGKEQREIRMRGGL